MSPEPQPYWKKILVATDLSDASLSAFREVRRFDGLSQCTVVVLHVIPVPFDGLRIHTGDGQQELRRSANTQMKSLVDTHFPGHPHVQSFIEEGAAAEVICAFAHKLGVDVIFIATHGSSALKQIVFGSVAAEVVRRAPCSVLVVRE